ncbi:ATP-dependent helicase, partial [Mesorhizobium sp. B1-1-5]
SYIDAGDVAHANGPMGPRSDPGSDPWLALAQVGAQFVAALAAANDPKAPAHPWIERDQATGVRSLKMPLPPPETARQLADALSSLADSLRGRTA